MPLARFKGAQFYGQRREEKGNGKKLREETQWGLDPVSPTFYCGFTPLVSMHE